MLSYVINAFMIRLMESAANVFARKALATSSFRTDRSPKRCVRQYYN
jgi:hypothetical protein